MSNEIVPYEHIENKIHLIRGQKVMLDRDLAELYGIDNRHLKRQVRRNAGRFPADFMFILTTEEVNEMVRHFGTPFRSKLGGSEPFAFTEHGILMLSSVLNSQRAINVNILIMRAFTRLRKMLIGYKDLKDRIDQLEAKYDGQFKVVFDAINQMLEEPEVTKVKGVGYMM